MNRHSVIDAIGELEKSGFLSAVRKPGKNTVYTVFPKLRPGPEVLDETIRTEITTSAYLGTGQRTAASDHLGTTPVPTQVLHQCLTKSADQVPELMEVPEGTPYKDIHIRGSSSGADALTHSLSYEKEVEVTEKEEDPRYQFLTKVEPPENSSFSVTKSETKHVPLREPAKLRRDPYTSGQRPESEAEVIAYVRSLGYEEEDGKYMWANWKSNGFTNGGRRIRDWRAVIDSRASQGFLPSQKKSAERTAKNHARRNLI